MLDLRYRNNSRCQLECKSWSSEYLPYFFFIDEPHLFNSYRLIAELMLPEGVHDQSEDWTVFLLNQTPANSISPLFSEGDESAGPSNGDDKELLYVLNLVLSKRDSSVRRYVLAFRNNARC
jgi:hypothetical protein